MLGGMTARSQTRSPTAFPPHITTSDVTNLPDIAPTALVTLAHRYLMTFPPIDLDPDQAQSWSWRQPGDPE